MTPEECLLKIIESCHKLDLELLDMLPQKRKDTETGRLVDQWLKWISKVNQPDWERDEEE